MGPDAIIFIFLMLSFKPAFSLSSFTFIKRLFSSSLISAIKVVSSAYMRLSIFLKYQYSNTSSFMGTTCPGMHRTCGILFLQLGIEPTSPALEGWGLNQWTTKEILKYFFSRMILKQMNSYYKIEKKIIFGYQSWNLIIRWRKLSLI